MKNYSSFEDNDCYIVGSVVVSCDVRVYIRVVAYSYT